MNESWMSNTHLNIIFIYEWIREHALTCIYNNEALSAYVTPIVNKYLNELNKNCVWNLSEIYFQ